MSKNKSKMTGEIENSQGTQELMANTYTFSDFQPFNEPTT